MPPLGPSQTKVTPGVEEAPLIEVLVDAQVITPPVAEALGASKSPFTVAVAVCVQAFRPVTVRVYTPGTVTAGFCSAEAKEPGPVQAYVAPVVVELPLSVRLGVPQDTVPPVAEAVGGKVLPVTVAEAVDVQPLAGLDTVTV